MQNLVQPSVSGLRDSGDAKRVLLVGATKGLGLAMAQTYLSRGWHVVATTLGPSEGIESCIHQYPGRIVSHPLDVSSEAEAVGLVDHLKGEPFDAVHIVAGVFQGDLRPIWEQPADEILRVLSINSIGGIRIAEKMVPQVRTGGVFAFTSSGMGSMTRNVLGDVDLYRISKAALNMLARSFAVRHADSGFAVLILCPGWAKTDMGGPDALVEVSDSVNGLYRLIANAKPSPEAQFFEYTGAVVPW